VCVRVCVGACLRGLIMIFIITAIIIMIVIWVGANGLTDAFEFGLDSDIVRCTSVRVAAVTDY